MLGTSNALLRVENKSCSGILDSFVERGTQKFFACVLSVWKIHEKLAELKRTTSDVCTQHFSSNIQLKNIGIQPTSFEVSNQLFEAKCQQNVQLRSAKVISVNA
ncbi:Capsule polysaccharide export inner-membrane protein CtrB [Frankliniella fusca]|uniref:Capsule polysaccharide export inner-membrane protein CtrB n=1 Tax=Frankliniella fusca TaxID=407009 RepID=A0AAE1GWP3_9NEOP|nr:Capsule polysaccharide export inner-membrane protein CtrB [Frankliniella fusca]